MTSTPGAGVSLNLLMCLMLRAELKQLLLFPGEYGQLGYQASCSDEPQRVEFFSDQQMCVVNVVCGAWNTFAAVVKDETAVT